MIGINADFEGLKAKQRMATLRILKRGAADIYDFEEAAFNAVNASLHVADIDAAQNGFDKLALEYDSLIDAHHECSPWSDVSLAVFEHRFAAAFNAAEDERCKNSS
nr:hypothetical protein [uncultured Dongia sp.]